MGDREAMPPSAQQEPAEHLQAFAHALVTGSGVRGRARRRRLATSGLVVDFWTWHSLVVEHGLDTTEAVDLPGTLFTCAVGRHGSP